MHDGGGANRRPAEPRQPQGDSDAQFNERRRSNTPAEKIDYGGGQVPVGGWGDEPSGNIVKKGGLALLDAAPDVSDGDSPAAGCDGSRGGQQREPQHDPIHVEPGLAAVLVFAKGKQTGEQEAGDRRAVEPAGQHQGQEHGSEQTSVSRSGQDGKPRRDGEQWKGARITPHRRGSEQPGQAGAEQNYAHPGGAPVNAGERQR